MLLLLALSAVLAGPPHSQPARPVEAHADWLDDARPLATLSPQAQAWREGDTAEPYHLYAEVLAEGIRLVERWPGRVTPSIVGRTTKGRPIHAFAVSNPGHPVQRRFLVFASIHALEWIGTEVALAFLQEMAARPPPGVEIVVVPLLNVDGRLRSEEDQTSGETRNYRRANARGIDLNRNFEVHTEARAIWRKVIPGYYQVPAQPLSESEAQAIDALGATGFDAAVSLHAFGGFHYLPWTGSWKRPPDWPALAALGQAMQRGQPRGAYKPMQLSRWGFFFRGHGMEIDHLYGKYGIPSVLVELTRSGLTGPKDLKTPFRWYNPRKPARHVELGVSALRAVAWDTATAIRNGETLPWWDLSPPEAP